MEGGERRNWKQHPLLKRLVLLALLGWVLWLTLGKNASKRELVWWLEGKGWSDIRALDFQVKNADGELVKRETRSFPSGPPGMVTLETELTSGTYEVWVFARGESGPSRPPLVERLTLGDEDERVERGLRVPVSR
ncbi:hypothetical protein ATI61_116122 [Archangium gephyra]|uniref:Uncharacterized protein n=1 Tax=Archangium gephyra TaxID=48 RepID=A0AAC8QA69_9BACT|nr:hypothetical protein [Archangium gephyra]AKJ03873.1 Hypothetical protein AA314_05499 [Archangium gephyra]REG23652.1 hypothetical protein ATI61_116122 [Archangium gephyra]